MSDGAASLMAMFYGYKASDQWRDTRHSNKLDGGAPFYGTYRCADGRWIAIGSIEPHFYSLLLEKTGITSPEFLQQMESASWPDLRAKLAAVIATKTRDEWTDIMSGTDVCFAPVLTMAEAPLDPHNLARQTFVNIEGVIQPAPAPRFSVTPGAIQFPPHRVGSDNLTALRDWGFSDTEVDALQRVGAL
jgi:alpha-methylacyl-CoA racemase